MQFDPLAFTKKEGTPDPLWCFLLFVYLQKINWHKYNCLWHLGWIALPQIAHNLEILNMWRNSGRFALAKMADFSAPAHTATWNWLFGVTVENVTFLAYPLETVCDIGTTMYSGVWCFEYCNKNSEYPETESSQQRRSYWSVKMK